MTDDRYDGNPRHWEARRLADVSASAYARLFAMTLEEQHAAEVMMRSDAYADFFVESPTAQFHEYVGPPDRAVEQLEVRASRMAIVDRYRQLDAASKYNDFFVDSPHNGPPFHEKFGDKGPKKLWEDEEVLAEVDAELATSPARRVDALRSLRVMDAFMRMQQTGGD